MRNQQNKDCREQQAGEANPESQPAAKALLKGHDSSGDSMKGASGGGPKHQGAGGMKHKATGKKEDMGY